MKHNTTLKIITESCDKILDGHLVKIQAIFLDDNTHS